MIVKKLIEQYGNIKIYLVDEEDIRNLSLENEEFTNYAINSDFPKMIPKNQIWLSKEAAKDERFFLINEALNRIKYEKLGMSSKQAYEKALQKDRAMREKKISSKNVYSRRVTPDEIYLENYGTIRGLEIWIVSGELIRNYYKTDWIEGGNECAYSWMPPNEIWVDQEVPKKERKFIIIHEMIERQLMKDKKISYNEAHKRAAKIEWRFRTEENGTNK